MINTIYQLKRPRQFEVTFKNIDIDREHLIVHPTHLSICNADQRYYQGLRAKEVMRKKLPMALIHEAIGRVVYDPTGTYKSGDMVVMIPNTPQEKDEIIAENYLRSSQFRASGMDGFLQEYIITTTDRVVALPEDINKYVAAFTEIVSVSYHAIKRMLKFSHNRKECIGIWGDGNLGYITALLVKRMIKECRVYVFGVNENKLDDFTFADKTYLVSEIPDELKVDHAFECVGGSAAGVCANQIIDCINPEGTISLLGVSEELVPLNTRMILEKGLCIYGSSRSGRSDFVELIELYRQDPDIVSYLEVIIGCKVVVKDIKDIVEAFEKDINKIFGKTIIVWEEEENPNMSN